MTFGYKINGSNTLFKVWGILVFVFGGIGVILGVIGFILQCTVASSDFANTITAIFKGAKNLVTLFIVFEILLFVISVMVKIITGILFIKENFISKWKFIFCTIMYYVAALGLLSFLIAFMVLINPNVGDWSDTDELAIFIIISCIIKIIWDIITGIFLIVKQGRLVPSTNQGIMPQQNYKPEVRKIPDESPFLPISPQPIMPSFPPEPAIPNTFVNGTIVGLFGSFQGQTFELHNGEVCKIGRESGCNIQVKHPKVSRIHCTVCKLPDGMYQITDTSTNGTFYNNKRLEKNVPIKVSPGGTLVVGEADNVMQLK